MKDLSSDGNYLMKFVDVPSFQKDDRDGFQTEIGWISNDDLEDSDFISVVTK